MVVLILGLSVVIMQHHKTISKQKSIIDQQTQALHLYKVEKEELKKNLEEEKKAFAQLYTDTLKTQKDLELQKNELKKELQANKCSNEPLPSNVINRLHKLTATTKD